MRILFVSLAALALAGAAPNEASLLTETDVVPEAILPPPPAETSAAHRAELAELAAMEASRTPAEVAAAKADDATKGASIFAEAIGTGFALDRLPETARLMAEVRTAEKFAADRAKAAFRRPRPWIANPSIKACSTDDEPLSSYPSGHTTMGYSMAAVLARLVPSRAPAIMARAARYGESRLVCEVHYRSDVTAGETLGLVVAERLMAKPAFQVQYARAAAELAALDLAAAPPPR